MLWTWVLFFAFTSQRWLLKSGSFLKDWKLDFPEHAIFLFIYFWSTLEFKVKLHITLSKLFPTKSEHSLYFKFVPRVPPPNSIWPLPTLQSHHNGYSQLTLSPPARPSPVVQVLPSWDCTYEVLQQTHLNDLWTLALDDPYTSYVPRLLMDLELWGPDFNPPDQGGQLSGTRGESFQKEKKKKE